MRELSGALILVPEETMWVLAPVTGTEALVTCLVTSLTASDLVGPSESTVESCLESSCTHPAVNCAR